MSREHSSPNAHPEHEAADMAAEAEKNPNAYQEAQDNNPEEDLEQRIATMAADLAAMEDRWKRSEAEKQNFQNRAEKEKADIRDYAVQKFARDLVGEIDNLQRALSALPAESPEDSENLKAIRKGLQSTEKSFLSMLERHGITRDNPVGKAFNPNEHEALQQMHSEDHAPGHIIAAHNPVWKLKNRLLKPAMVMVAADSSTGKAPEETR